MCGILTKRTSRRDVRGKLFPNNEANNEVCLVAFPTWRTTRRCRAAEVVAGTASAKVVADADQ